MKHLFFTHCSKTKDDKLRGTGRKVSPCELYQAQFVQDFCQECEKLGLTYAIFSDLHGFVFPTDRIEWYDKNPSELCQNEEERRRLFDRAYSTLRNYSHAYFYHLPDRLHQLYRMLIDDVTKRGVKITEITEVSQLAKLSKT